MILPIKQIILENLSLQDKLLVLQGGTPTVHDQQNIAKSQHEHMLKGSYLKFAAGHNNSHLHGNPLSAQEAAERKNDFQLMNTAMAK